MRIGIYVCRCGGNISEVVDVEEVKSFAEKQPDVVLVRDHEHMCSELGQKLVVDDIKENKLESAYIRPLLFYSFGNLGLIPEASPVEVVIGSWEWGTLFGDKARIGVHTCIVPWRRIHYSQFDIAAKLGGTYVQSTICGKEARSQGFDEAVFLNLEGNVAEGSGANIFIVKDGILRTNDKKESILEGITRTSILEIAKDLGIDYSVGLITKEDFFNADEAFFTGTAVELVPIIRVTDNSNPESSKKEYTIGSGQTGAITQKLAKTFRDVVNGKIKKYEKWLTYVYD